MVICQRFQLTPSFYKRITFGNTLHFKATPGPSSSKLFSIFLTQSDISTGDLLLNCQRQLAYINPSTSRVLPIADTELKNSIPGTSLIRIPLISIPERHFLWRMRVTHSDTDYANHVNQSSYLRFCLNAAAAAADEGFLKTFKKDIFEYKLKETDLLYQDEAFVGQNLDVFVWESADRPNSLFFQIKRNDANILCGTISFYANDEWLRHGSARASQIIDR